MSLQLQHFWKLIVLGFLTLLLTLIPLTSTAQIVGTNSIDKASVVVDGHILFEVGNFGNFTAAERAKKINEALEDVVTSSDPIQVEVITDNNKTAIRNQTSDRHLLNVTEADVISASNEISQALIWRGRIEAALRQGRSERTPAYLRQALLFTVIVIFGAIAIQLGLGFLGKWINYQINRFFGDPASDFHSWEKPAQIAWQITFLLSQVGLWLFAIVYITSILPEARSWRYKVFNFLTSRIFSLGSSNYSALELLMLLAFTVGLWFAVRSFTQLFKSYFLSRTGADQGAQDIIAIITQYIITFLGLIVLWQIWGLDVGALALLASVLGVGIGFGLQNITNNFISGLIITLERSIQVGDFINVGDLVGTVKRIGARSTEIRTLDRVSIIVPNARFLENEVINWTHNDPISRLRITIGVAYGSDVKKVRMALLEAARSHRDILNRPYPQVRFLEFGDSSLNFELLIWTKKPQRQFLLKSDLNYRIEESLRRYSLEVPFPQRDINLRSPQIEHFIAAWFKQQGLQPLNMEEGNQLSDISSSPPNISSIESISDSFLESLEERLTTSEIEELVKIMRSPEGLEIKNRRYRLNFYPSCFVGSEAVTWLMENQAYSREEAVELGQILLEKGIIHHVANDQPFRDGFFFYRFYSDEKNLYS